MTLEDHQASRFVNEPLRLFDCCLFTDGGGAFVVTTAERARDLQADAGADLRRSARCTPPRSSSPRDDGRGGGSEAGEQAYRDGGLQRRATSTSPSSTTPSRRASSTTWSPTASPTGTRSARWSARASSALGGRLPCNTAGGLLSEGHLSGIDHVAEAVRQVRGTSCNQVPDVELSMVTGLRRRAARAAAHGRVHRGHPGTAVRFAR